MYYYFCEFTAVFDARTGKLGGRVGRFWHFDVGAGVCRVSFDGSQYR
jgi:hypothetical protein